MDQITPEIAEATSGLLGQAEIFLRSLLIPWRLYQVGGIVALVLVAFLLRPFVSARFMDHVRAKEGLAKWQLRWAVVLNNNFGLLIYALLSWGTVLVMQQVTWPSRSHLIGISATIATALLLVGLAAKIIRNRSLSRLVTWGAGIWVVAVILNFEEGGLAFLDSLAVTFGDFRMSALTVIKALVVTGLLVSGARLITKGASNRIKANPDMSPSMQVLAIKVVQMALFGGAIFVGLKAVGFDLTGLAVLSGAIGVGLGFGLQKVVSNLVSGIIILLDKSIKPGDVISRAMLEFG
jgi:small-conductance mechanosensitive channel